jgi:hypothetical protein
MRTGLRRSALIALTMLAALWGADAAQATIPARVADNLRGIAEFQYKMFSTSQDENRRFPTCHRVCTHLWNLQLQFSTSSDTDQAVWRQLYVLGKRDGLFKGFTDYTIFSKAVPATDQNEENIFGDWPWRADDPPRRHLGVTIPHIDGVGIESTARLVQPGERVMSSVAGDNHGHTWESTVDSPELAWYVVGPAVWHGERCGAPADRPHHLRHIG